MEELIKAKDEQIEKLNNLKELLKEQILSLQEENTQLKNELFEIEEKFKLLSNDASSTPDYQTIFNSINAKLSIIEEKLDKITVDALVSSSSSTNSNVPSKPKAINEKKIKNIEPHPAERGLLKPSSLFPELESDVPPDTKNLQLYQENSVQKTDNQPSSASAPSFNAADPRSLQRSVMEIDYPKNGVIQCPKCGKMDFNEMPEPSRGSFAKKYYCKKCRQEWRFIY